MFYNKVPGFIGSFSVSSLIVLMLLPAVAIGAIQGFVPNISCITCIKKIFLHVYLINNYENFKQKKILLSD